MILSPDKIRVLIISLKTSGGFLPKENIHLKADMDTLLQYTLISRW